MLVYDVKIQTMHGWVTLASYGEELLHFATAVADRAIFAHKTHSQVVERKPDGMIVYEKFYNRDDDEDEKWKRDWRKERDLGLSWKEAGF